MAILALKSMARQVWTEDDPQRPSFRKCWYEPVTDPAETELALRFTLSLPITAALPPGEAALFRTALDAAARFRPITDDEEQTLRNMASPLEPIFGAA